MRYVFLLVPLLLLAACGPANSVTASPGCANINDPFYDRVYRSGQVFFSPFKAGESLSIKIVPGSAAEAEAILLIITDASERPSKDVLRLPSSSAEGLNYTFTQNYAELELYWSADAGVPRWEVECGSE